MHSALARYSRRYKKLIYLISTTFFLLTIGSQTICAKTPKVLAPSDDDAQDILSSLKGNDPTAKLAAMTSIHNFYPSQAVVAARYLKHLWIPALVEAKQYDLAEELALYDILNAPYQTGDVVAIQTLRVRIATLAGKPQLALSHARGLFNISSMKDTPKALLLLSDCFKSVYAGDSAKVEQFKAEQIAGSKTDAPPPSRSMLKDIPIDDSVYFQAIAKLTPSSTHYDDAKGNLLLLAGHPTEARKLFEEELASAKLMGEPAKTTQSIQQQIARAIKAEDGLIGRANAYVISNLSQPVPPIESP